MLVAHAEVFGIGVAELAVLTTIGFAALAYTLRELLDLLGKSPRQARLREENSDLLRRNGELDAEVKTLHAEVARLEAEVVGLRGEVGEFKKRDQKAVLDAISRHEVDADRRAAETVALLTEIRDLLRSGR